MLMDFLNIELPYKSPVIMAVMRNHSDDVKSRHVIELTVFTTMINF